MIDLGRYPGARPAGGSAKWVRGELFELRHPVRNLKVLDDLEGFVPNAPERSAFERQLAEVILANGVRRQSWIYWLGRGSAW